MMKNTMKPRPFVDLDNHPLTLPLVLARQEFNNLESWLCSEKVQQMNLREVELGEEIRGRELLRLSLQAHIERRGDGDVGVAIKVLEPATSATVLYTHRRIRVRRIVTIFGKVRVRRLRYGTEGKCGIYPLDEHLQLPSGGYSYELQRRLVKKAVCGPFDEAVSSLNEATGVKMSKRTAEKIVIRASRDFDDFYAQRQGDTRDDTGPILVASVDSKGIPMIKSELAAKIVRRRKGQKAQKKKMATVAAVYTQRPRIRTPEEVVKNLFDPEEKDGRNKEKPPRSEKKRVWASLKAGKDVFINGVSEEVNRRDPHADKIRSIVTDGERALQIRVHRFMPNAVLILDIIHVLEKLWDAGHALYGEGSDNAREFVKNRALRILRGEVSQVVKGLRQTATKRKLREEKEKAIRNAANYFYKNRRRMHYDEYLKLGLPIASGSVEGACKNLIKDRMERSGMRWSAKMAEAMVKIRATYLSGDFDEYWNFHIVQDQNRLHPKDRWKPTFCVVKK